VWQTFVQWFTDVINMVYVFTEQIGLPSYGLAIIFMTILIKVVLFPLTQKQMKSMRAMQEIQPKTKYIQEKYKDDQATQQQKIMELYKEHGVNPFGGCLPLLIQMPIFFAFYKSLYNFNYLDTAHKGFLWIPDISLPDPFYILAILAAVTTYIQQKISMTQSNDPTQKTMLYFMPLFMAWIAFKMPAGLPLYWVVFNILGILQQLYVNRLHSNAKLDTGTGIQIETTHKIAEPDYQEQNNKDEVERRAKGGKETDARPNSRKKGKKR
jgi:membrane protein insertase, YidC/Oxa1 family, C-terminal domain